jgi:hypothetical protein
MALPHGSADILSKVPGKCEALSFKLPGEPRSLVFSCPVRSFNDYLSSFLTSCQPGSPDRFITQWCIPILCRLLSLESTCTRRRSLTLQQICSLFSTPPYWRSRLRFRASTSASCLIQRMRLSCIGPHLTFWVQHGGAFAAAAVFLAGMDRRKNSPPLLTFSRELSCLCFPRGCIRSWRPPFPSF